MSSESHEAATRSLDGRRRAVQRAEPGEHLCCFHGTGDEQYRLAAAFVRSALGAGDRLVYVANERGHGAIAPLLGPGGVYAGGPVRSGQLVVRDVAEVYGSPSAIDVDAVLARYRDEAERSRADGYPGLRVAVDMGDVVGRLGSLAALARWENMVTLTFGEVGIIGMCQYDRRVVDSAAEARITAEHPAVATDDGTVPLAMLTATETPWGLQVVGDLDRSNAPAFARALRARTVVRPRVQVDLGALGFADVAALRTVFEVARELRSDSALVLGPVPARVRSLLGLLRWHDPRVEVEPQ